MNLADTHTVSAAISATKTSGKEKLEKDRVGLEY